MAARGGEASLLQNSGSLDKPITPGSEVTLRASFALLLRRCCFQVAVGRRMTPARCRERHRSRGEAGVSSELRKHAPPREQGDENDTTATRFTPCARRSGA